LGKHGEILLDQVHGHVDFDCPLCGTLHADGILQTKDKIQDLAGRCSKSDIVLNSKAMQLANDSSAISAAATALPASQTALLPASFQWCEPQTPSLQQTSNFEDKKSQQYQQALSQKVLQLQISS